MELTATKELIDSILKKIQVIDFILQSLATNYPGYKDRIELQVRQASNHKLKLTAEILRLTGCDENPPVTVEEKPAVIPDIVA